MTQTDKDLRSSASLKWVLTSIALLLTVVSLVGGSLEAVTGGSPVARGVAGLLAIIASTAAGAVFTWQRMLMVERRLNDRMDRNAADWQRRLDEHDEHLDKRVKCTTKQIIAAIAETRLTQLADLVEGVGTVRSINDNKR